MEAYSEMAQHDGAHVVQSIDFSKITENDTDIPFESIVETELPFRIFKLVRKACPFVMNMLICFKPTPQRQPFH